MKKTHRYTTIVTCDMVTVTETDTEIIHTEQCAAKFYTSSISAMARGQAKNEKWQRPKVRHVRWPGQPPMDGGKRVDLCPDHTETIMTAEEYKAAKKAERAAAKAAKPKTPRKRKPKPAPVEEQPA